MSFLKKAQQQIAHNTVAPSLIGNSDLKQLQAIITTEKEWIKANTKAASDFGKNIEAIKAWGSEEGEDLRVSSEMKITKRETLLTLFERPPQDVTGKVTVLWEHYPSSIQRFNTHLSTIRLHHKAIRTREESLSELRSRKRSLAGRIESVEKKLAKMGPENKELAKTTSSLKELRNEMSALSQEVLVETAGLEDFKRRSIKESLGMKCSALVELAEKMIVMAEMAGAMLEELDMEPMQPGGQRRMYAGTPKTEDLLQEGLRCLADVTFRPINSTAPSSFRGPTGGQQQQQHQAGEGYGAPPFLSHHPDRTLSASEMTVGDSNNTS